MPILDSIREFKVMTGTYSAEFGRQSGAQIVVTSKAGTNEYHGSLWEFHRNSALDARNFFAPSKPSYRRNQFGGLFSGRIVKDKTFFMMAYEGQRRGQQDTTLRAIPPATFRAGDFRSLNTPIRDPRANCCRFLRTSPTPRRPSRTHSRSTCSARCARIGSTRRTATFGGRDHDWRFGVR